MMHVGWLDRETGQMHRPKPDTRPEPWWVPLYVDAAEMDAADDALMSRGMS